MRLVLQITLAIVSPIALAAQTKLRENDLKLPIGGTPGALDAITDVSGVEVGHTTLISGNGRLVIGKGPVRTGVTVIHPRGKKKLRSSLRSVVHAEWQRRDDGNHMDSRERISRGTHRDHEHPQRRRRARRDHQWEVSQKNVLQPWWLPVVAETYPTER
jgi:hypothetical protein